MDDRFVDRLWLGLERKWWTLIVVGSGTFMSALDTSVVNIALPAIGHGTGAPLATLEWVVLAYLLVLTGTLLVFGRIADVHGKRPIYMAGQVLFATGSLLCGVSRQIGPLVASRAVRGLGASMILALSPAVLISAFPADERGRALGLQATMTYLGLSIGPALGGWLTEHLGWPAIFLVNVPIGLAMVALSSRVLAKEARPAHAPPPFDVIGAVLMVAALSALLFAVSHGQQFGWNRPLIAGLLAASAAGWLAFVAVERGAEHPVLDVRLFSSWTFSASTLAAFLCYCCTAAVNLTAPFLLIRGCGLSESRAGLGLMAIPLAMLTFTAPAAISRTASACASQPRPGWSRSAQAPSCCSAWRPGRGGANIPAQRARGGGRGRPVHRSQQQRHHGRRSAGAARRGRSSVDGRAHRRVRLRHRLRGRHLRDAHRGAAHVGAVHACMWAVAAVAVVAAILSAAVQRRRFGLAGSSTSSGARTLVNSSTTAGT